MSKVGRPTDFNEEIAEKIITLYAEGKTEEQVAEIIGKTEPTLRNWKKAHQQFFWATQEAKAFADSLVERAGFKAATGYYYEEESETDKGVVVQKKYARPDPTMIKYWLNNRKPKQWKDRVEVQMETKDTLMVVAGGNKLPIKR